MAAGDLPVIRVFAWDVGEIASPVGTRHIAGGHFAFKYMVASGCMEANPLRPGSTSGTLLFEDTKFDLTTTPVSSHLASKPACITFNLAASGTAISEMRLFLVSDSAFQASKDQGLDRAFMQYAPSGSLWRYNLSLPSGSVARMPLTVPSIPNIHRQDGTPGIVAQDDLNSSEFVYLNIVVPLGTPLGSFGVCGSGLLRFALLFNYWSSEFYMQFGS